MPSEAPEVPDTASAADSWTIQTEDKSMVEDGIVTKAIDRFVDLLNPIEDEMDDEDTLISEVSDARTAQGSNPTLMQQLDKHVLTRFGCSSNPAYVPEDEEASIGDEELTKEELVDKSTESKPESIDRRDNSIIRVEDSSGDPEIQLKSMDEDNARDDSIEQPEGGRNFFCGALPLGGGMGNSEAMDEKISNEKNEDGAQGEQSKGALSSSSQLDEEPFDVGGKKEGTTIESEEAPPTEKTALEQAKETLGQISENVAPMVATVKETIMNKVLSQNADDKSFSKAGEDLHMVEETPAPETTEASNVEGGTPSAEAAMEEGEDVSEQDKGHAEQGEEVDASPDILRKDVSEIPFDEKSPEPSASAVDEALAEGAPEKEEPKQGLKEEVKAPVAAATKATAKRAVKPAATSSATKSKANADQIKEKKKKKGFFSRIFKKKNKNKKKQPQKESILRDDEKKGIDISGKVDVPEESASKRPTPIQSSVGPTTAEKEATAKKEIFSDKAEADFDLLVSKNASNKNNANDDWEKLANTPTKSKLEGSATSPAGVSNFPVEI